MQIIDSHQHFLDFKRFHYEWMNPKFTLLRRNYLPQNLLPLLQESRVQRTVVVQATHSTAEKEWLLEVANENKFVAGVVGWVDLMDRNVSRVLDRLTKNPKLKGVRHQVEDESDEHWLLREDAIHGLKEVARYDLTYDLLVRPNHLKHIPALVERVPDLRMVVDHIAKPPIAAGRRSPWADNLANVASIPGIHCKLSGMVTEANSKFWKSETIEPYVQQVLTCFGIDRLLWGSDWPVCLLAASYQSVLQVALDTVGTLTYSEREKFLGQNAVRFYNLS